MSGLKKISLRPNLRTNLTIWSGYIVNMLTFSQNLLTSYRFSPKNHTSRLTMSHQMILDLREHLIDGKASITRSLAETINPLAVDQSVSIEWLIDTDGKKLNPAYLQKFIKSATKGRYVFKSRTRMGNLLIWRIAECDILAKRKSGVTPNWPMASMKIGDAATIKQGQYGKASAANYPHVFGAQTGAKFSVNKISQDTYRVIRIE